ncbi:uncharacterized protein JCM6883_007017 [Sporobolomyces salmoneus]|uniref:uncharacterized protein n=1 Tax=Sporobolomyces salmoneus TaxID=183962 RepID=UPI003171FBBA
MKRRASPDRDSSTPLPTPHTSTNLPLPLPLPPPPPAPVDPTILQPLYAEIDRLRGVVDTLQSRLHWFEGVVAFAMAQPHSQPTDQAQAQAQPREDTSSAHEPPSMLTPIPSPPSAAGYSFYPPRSPAFPPHNLPYCPLPAPPSAPSAPLASTPYPPERQDVAYSHPSSGLQLTSLSVPPPQFPLPTPTIPRAQLGDDAMEHERERKRLRVEGEEAHGRSEEGRREGERIGDGTTMMSRRGSSSLNKLLSTTEGVDGLAR